MTMKNRIAWYIDIANEDAQKIVDFLNERDIDYVETIYADISDIGHLNSIKRDIANGYTVICIGLTDEEYYSDFELDIICVLSDYFNNFINLYNRYGDS